MEVVTMSQRISTSVYQGENVVNGFCVGFEECEQNKISVGRVLGVDIYHNINNLN
jgi:hypothetical protein